MVHVFLSFLMDIYFIVFLEVPKAFDDEETLDFAEEVIYFSREYRKKGKTFLEVIEANAEIAESRKKIKIALFWKNLLSIFSPHRFLYFFFFFFLFSKFLYNIF